jgi:hypothetical protein
MRKVFISYARQNKPDVEQLVEHLRVLGCDTWHDSSLHGGQDWWEEILQRISDCDTFIPIISDEALQSTACQLEFDWTEALGKPVLPVAVKRPSKALPGRFSRRQYVDYSDPESRDQAALRLAGGLAALPAAPPLPDPLPEPPAAPLSYLTDLIDRVSQHEALNEDQQRRILDQLKPALRSIDQEEREGGRDVLDRLNGRRDLSPSVAWTIAQLRSGRMVSGTPSGKPIDWDDLLGHIEDQRLVPVVGPELAVINTGNVEQTFSSLIGQRLASKYQLDMSSEIRTMGEAVAAILQAQGRDEVELLYGPINRIIKEIDPEPGDALRDLARIDAMRLFVSTTPDRLLAKALDDVRFQGRPVTREVSFSPNQSLREQVRNAQPAAPTDAVVLSLFGQAASTREYAIDEEDRLEWLHPLLSDMASLPDWLAYPLKHQSMLFVGCDLSDSLWQFLLRILSSAKTQLSVERKQFFFVGSSRSELPSLSSSFGKAHVQQLQMAPTEFVAELRARWEEHVAARPPAPVSPAGAFGSGAPTIFISYLREDADAARRLCDAITRLGGDVWLDERRLRPDDAWESEILGGIRRTVRLFVPIISANTERAEDDYVFVEWREAVDRSRSIPSRRFIVPVIVDEDYQGDPSRYRQIPDDIGRLQFGHAPGGAPDPELLAMLTTEIRAMRRTNAP